MKKLSIITITYNDKEGLEKTFESVQSQTWKDFEYLVIDGGSTDGSKELIEKNTTIDYWVSEKDSGVYNAMNKGIQAAKGKYIIFMNSGDSFYDETVLEKTAPKFDTDISILYGNSIYFKKDGFRREEIFPDKLSFSFFHTSGINHQATFIKRALFFDYFLYNEDYKICSDWEFFIYTICAKNESYLHLGYFICNYDFMGMSSDPKNLATFFKEKKQTIHKYFPLFEDDYKLIDEFQHKRVRNLIYIKQFKFPWLLLKSFSKFLLLFLPKQPKGKQI
jgi:glycosyltransferase involved in cell wall biosynthesis